jgi:hypothetical protein
MKEIVFVVLTAAPPLSSADATQVLRTCACDSRRIDTPTPAPPSLRVPSSPTAGPFGELRSTPLPVSYRGPFIHPRTPELIVYKRYR